MASLTWWTWVWVSSRSRWWIGKPGVLQFMGSQSRTRLSDWTELSWQWGESGVAHQPRSIAKAPITTSALSIAVIIKWLPLLHSLHQPGFYFQMSPDTHSEPEARPWGCQNKTPSLCVCLETRVHTFPWPLRPLCLSWRTGLSLPSQGSSLSSPCLVLPHPDHTRFLFLPGGSSQSASSWLLPRGSTHRWAVQVNQFITGFSLKSGLLPLSSLIVWKVLFWVLNQCNILTRIYSDTTSLVP